MTTFDNITNGSDWQVRPTLRTVRAGRMPTYVHLLPTFTLSMIVFAWFVTWGDWRLFDAERFGGYYDAQARAMLHGRLDVPPAAIGFEAFIRDGKSYGYFGIAPALLRLPVLLMFPGMDGRWSRLYVLIACGLNLVYAHRLLLLVIGSTPRQLLQGKSQPKTHAPKIIHHLFILSAGVGSTTVFLASRSYTYHEAILWGSTFALMFAYYILRFSETSRPRLLAIAGLYCFLSFMSRGTAGAGALLAMVVLFVWLIANGRIRIALIAFTTIAITITTYLGINYAKFHTFDSVPVRYYGLYLKDPDRMKATGGKQIHLTNFPTNTAAYFGLAGLATGPQFPWIYMTTQPTIYPGSVIDVIEPHSSIPITMPALLLLTVLGLKGTVPIVCAARSSLKKGTVPINSDLAAEMGTVPFSAASRQAVPLCSGTSKTKGIIPFISLAMLAGGSVVLVTVGITQRYLHDFYPFLIVAGAAGAGRLMLSRRAGVTALLLAPLVLVSILVNCAFAFDFQREIVWGVPEAKRAELADIRNTVDRFLHRPVAPAAAKEQP